MSLTAKQEMFCREYLKDLNATQAAIRAGYSEKTARATACENLTKQNIQDKIAELKSDRSERVRIDSDWVLVNAKRVFDRCMQEEAIVDRNGDPVVCKTETGDLAAAYKFDSSGANKALELVGKHVNVRAWDKDADDGDQDVKNLNITFEVRDPVRDVKITNAKP